MNFAVWLVVCAAGGFTMGWLLGIRDSRRRKKDYRLGCADCGKRARWHVMVGDGTPSYRLCQKHYEREHTAPGNPCTYTPIKRWWKR